MVDALLHEHLDAAFVRSPVRHMSSLLVDAVLDEPMVVAMPTAHRLRSDTAVPLPLCDLASEAFVLYRRPAGPGLDDSILAACHAAGFSPTVTQEAPRPTEALSLVAAGLGVSVVPASMHRLGADSIAYRGHTDCPGLSAPLHLVMRPSIPPSTLASFRDLVRRLRNGHP